MGGLVRTVSVMLTPTIPLPIFPAGVRTNPEALIRIFVPVRFAGTVRTAGKARSVGAWFGAGCIGGTFTKLMMFGSPGAVMIVDMMIYPL